MKKLLPLCLTIIFLMAMWGCGKQPASPQETSPATTSYEDTPESAMLLYQEFLASDNPQAGEESLFYKDEWERYAFFDMNGDGLPELHIHSRFVYNIVTCKNGELHIWKSLSTCAEPLNNRAVLETRTGMPLRTQYTYYEYDFHGNEQLEVVFLKAMAHLDNNKWIYDENSDYWFGNKQVSKEEWDSLTEPYFSIGSDKIEWMEYSGP